MPVIRVDDEVWAWLKELARPLEDTPNMVLRRVAGLDGNAHEGGAVTGREDVDGGRPTPPTARGRRTNSGRNLNEQWEVGARHALYHRDGTYYNHLREFPGALFDATGFVLFKSERDYLTSPYLQHGQQLNVPIGIAAMPGYVRKA